MMSEAPMLSVVVLSWNRWRDLFRVLRALRELRDITHEVIVVDNASTDITVRVVKRYFPEVRLLVLERNIGIAGWNAGFDCARGEYLLALDDDSYPEPDGLLEALAEMQGNPRIGVLGLRVINEQQGREETWCFAAGPVISFVGCGVLLRGVVVRSLGGFDAALFLYEHETEFAMRAWDAGFEVYFFPGSTVHHIASLRNRVIQRPGAVDQRRVYYTVRNILYVLLTRFGLRRVGGRVLRIVLGRSVAAARHGSFGSALRGIRDGLFLGWRARGHGPLLGEETQRRYGYGAFAGGFFFEDTLYSLKRPRWLSGG